MNRVWVAAAALLVIGSACTSSFAQNNPALCGADKVQQVKDYVAKAGMTPQDAADKAATDAAGANAHADTVTDTLTPAEPDAVAKPVTGELGLAAARSVRAAGRDARDHGHGPPRERHARGGLLHHPHRRPVQRDDRRER